MVRGVSFDDLFPEGEHYPEANTPIHIDPAPASDSRPSSGGQPSRFQGDDTPWIGGKNFTLKEPKVLSDAEKALQEGIKTAVYKSLPSGSDTKPPSPVGDLISDAAWHMTWSVAEHLASAEAFTTHAGARELLYDAARASLATSIGEFQAEFLGKGYQKTRLILRKHASVTRNYSTGGKTFAQVAETLAAARAYFVKIASEDEIRAQIAESAGQFQEAKDIREETRSEINGRGVDLSFDLGKHLEKIQPYTLPDEDIEEPHMRNVAYKHDAFVTEMGRQKETFLFKTLPQPPSNQESKTKGELINTEARTVDSEGKTHIDDLIKTSKKLLEGNEGIAKKIRTAFDHIPDQQEPTTKPHNELMDDKQKIGENKLPPVAQAPDPTHENKDWIQPDRSPDWDFFDGGGWDYNETFHAPHKEGDVIADMGPELKNRISVADMWNELNRSFNSSFPIGGAPPEMIKKNQVLQLRIRVADLFGTETFGLGDFTVRVTDVKYTGDEIMFKFAAEKSHVDGPGSTIEFHITNGSDGYPQLNVIGHIAGGPTTAPIVGKGEQEAYMGGVDLTWQRFIDQLTTNTAIHQLHLRSIPSKSQ